MRIFVKKLNIPIIVCEKMEKLPFKKDIETKKLPSAHRVSAELKGIVSSIQNENILNNTFGLQEAKDSSAIKNIITTHDDLYKAGLKSLNAKEVQNYIASLKNGFQLISKHKTFTNNDIIKIQSVF